MKRIAALILALVMVLALAACGSSGGDNGGNSGSNRKNSSGIEQVDCAVAVNDYYIATYKGNTVLVLLLDVTNKGGHSIEARDLANPTIYQNGAQVGDVNSSTWASDYIEGCIDYQSKIQNDATATVYYLFKLENTTDDISLEVYSGESLVGDDGNTWERVGESNVVLTETLKLD